MDVVDFHIESNCKQFDKEADSDKEGQITTSENHSRVTNYTIQQMFPFEMYV